MHMYAEGKLNQNENFIEYQTLKNEIRYSKT